MGHKNERGHHVCPWYMAYLFDNPLRSLIHRPGKILGPYVKAGMNVLDMGCGMGYFSLGMAELVGPQGRVLSLDLQERMLRVLERRARRRGLSERIRSHLITGRTLPVRTGLDFALCFWMVHEVPDPSYLFRELHRVLRPGARVLVAEPGMHVTMDELELSVRLALAEGFSVIERPRVSLSHAVVLVREGE